MVERGELFDDPDNSNRLALDSPQTLDAMQDFLDLGIHNPPIPDDEDVEAEDLESRFLNGRLAMLLSSRRSTPTFRTITDFDWDIAPLPMHTQPAGILHSDAYCMTRASGAKDAARDSSSTRWAQRGADHGRIRPDGAVAD